MGCIRSKPKHDCMHWNSLHNCRCLATGVSVLPCRTVLYHQSGLISYRGHLWQSIFRFDYVGLHRIPTITAATTEHLWVEGRLVVWLVLRGSGISHHLLEYAGLWRVRRIQRWMRRILNKPKALALVMGLHQRLGQGSGLMALDGDLLRMCWKLV